VIKDNYLLIAFQIGKKLNLVFLKDRFLDCCFFIVYQGPAGCNKCYIKPKLFADDISLILATPDYIQLKDDLVAVSGMIIDWFQANLLTLNIKRNPRNTCTLR
jgi:hypothetical protein